MTTPRPMRADARRNYERIVAIAREVFVEQGPEAPLDDIARRAGVGAGTLYRHFPRREDLMAAVYSEDLRKISELGYQLQAEHDPPEALELWMREQVRFVLQKNGLAKTLKAAMDTDSETFALCKTMMSKTAETLLTAAQDTNAVRPDVEPRDLLLLAHGVAVAAESNPDALERLLSITLDGLKPRT
jgi:AcrR family transcriptional regulator